MLKGRGFLGGRGTPENQPPAVHLGNCRQSQALATQGGGGRGGQTTRGFRNHAKGLGHHPVNGGIPSLLLMHLVVWFCFSKSHQL